MPGTPELGDRIKRLRLSRNLTLKELERKAQVSATHVSEIERGLTSPTVGAFRRIAEALGVSSARLVGKETDPAVSVVRRGDRSVLLDPSAGARFATLGGAGMSMVEIDIEPGRTMEPLRRPYSDEEFVYVLGGVVEIAVETGKHLLKEGDAIHHRPGPGRTFRNIGDGPARLLWLGVGRGSF
ncbi:MAG: helix-turn-helix transcriptional regulator [Candidatus Krumholzibacteriota bacterium]|nr:helix-turn-helix transcriptional regulator [Candidatus Krumholzibacteriota bacterium]